VGEGAYMMHNLPIHPRDPNQKQRIGGKANNRDVCVRKEKQKGPVTPAFFRHSEDVRTMEDVDAIAGGGAIGVGPSTSGSESSE
jgi:hypothetical protein